MIPPTCRADGPDDLTFELPARTDAADRVPVVMREAVMREVVTRRHRPRAPSFAASAPAA